METQPDKLTIEQVEESFRIFDGKPDPTSKYYASVYRQLADIMRENEGFKKVCGIEDYDYCIAKKTDIENLQRENVRLRNFISDAIRYFEGDMPQSAYKILQQSNKPSLPENPWQHGEEYVEPYQPKTTG